MAANSSFKFTSRFGCHVTCGLVTATTHPKSGEEGTNCCAMLSSKCLSRSRGTPNLGTMTSECCGYDGCGNGVNVGGLVFMRASTTVADGKSGQSWISSSSIVNMSWLGFVGSHPPRCLCTDHCTQLCRIAGPLSHPNVRSPSSARPSVSLPM